MGLCASSGDLPREEKLRSETSARFQQMRAECEMAISDSVMRIQQFEQMKAALLLAVKKSCKEPTLAQEEEMKAHVTQIRAHTRRIEAARTRYNTLTEAERRVGQLIDAKRDAEFHKGIAKNMSSMGFDAERVVKDMDHIDDTYDLADEYASTVEQTLNRGQNEQADIEAEVALAWRTSLDDAPRVPPDSGTELVPGFVRNRRRGRVRSDKTSVLDEEDVIELIGQGRSETTYALSPPHEDGTDPALIEEFGG